MAHSDLVLYSFRRCPYAIRARMALAQAGLSYTLREVDLKHKPEAMLIQSPKGTVPVLCGTPIGVIDESLEIIKWASQQTQTELQIDLNTCPWMMRLHDTYIPLFNAIKHDFLAHQDTPRVQTALAQIKAFLVDLDALCRDQDAPFSCPWLNIALFPSIRQLWILNAFASFREGFVHITRWVETVKDSAMFERIMQKHAPWDPTLNQVVYITNT